MTGESIQWTRSPGELAEIGRFFASVIVLDPSYISHGEIQSGLSPDGETWSRDLRERFEKGLPDLDERCSVCRSRSPAGEVEAAAIVRWVDAPDRPYAVLEDLAVTPDARGGGIGAGLLGFVEREARTRGCHWVFLESGIHNEGAHEFFRSHGYAPVSKVFRKRLVPPLRPSGA